ncbi:alpha-S2-casein isoform X2 [Phacochoerus africanus]|uniref:alpha-S2-casein isoform X2 n=1 Tax=Phacochoerus africanus TaxID=41426 RepID=UPI001FD8E66B|nr:alpha-S2-casein isoform X2 [Phacochoerus africanus]
MKFFIFTCLLAIAFAKHEMEHVSSSEESINISQEKYKQEKNVMNHPSKEDICAISCEEAVRNIKELGYASSSSSEESVDIPAEEKISQFYQKFPQYLQALYQAQIVMNPWDQTKTSAYPFIPTVIQSGEELSTSEEPVSSSQEENTKTVDMESMEEFTKKTELTEEEKNRIKFLNKIKQYYQKFTWPQYIKTVHQKQKAMKPWNHIKTNSYQIIPNLRYF